MDTENIEVKLNSKKIKGDSLLRSKVEQEDKYNLSININSNESFLFFPPLSGYISQKFDPSKKAFRNYIVAGE